MAFLTPAFLLGLSAIAIPVLIHLIQRERKRVIEFPSLMFVRRIPYQSVRRRRIRHWFLLLLRAAAVALIVAEAPRDGVDQRLPESRLERIRRSAFPRRDDAQHGVGGIAGYGESRGP